MLTNKLCTFQMKQLCQDHEHKLQLGTELCDNCNQSIIPCGQGKVAIRS